MTPKPDLPPPPPLRAAETGTFTHHSVVNRLPDIGRRALAENDLPPDAAARLNALIEEIPEAEIRPLSEPHAPDAADWRQYVAAHSGQDWLQIPWFFAETYFYRRILEATGYFRDGPGRNVDPFLYQKRRGLETTRTATHALSSWLQEALAGEGETAAALHRLLAADLWGNQADLSLWPADDNDQNDQMGDEQREKILVDDTAAVVEHLLQGGVNHPVPRVDFLADNAGFELVVDLALADFLLTAGVVTAVRCHLKSHPTFVSDAMPKDVQDTVAFLADDAHQATQTVGQRLRGHLKNGRLQLTHHPFWTSPLPAWEMPAALQTELAGAHLIISKGDANYRRLLGDRHWPFTTPFAAIVAYLPAPLAALRTLKSDVAAGLTADQLEEQNQKDPDWRINGQWGLIQLASAI